MGLYFRPGGTVGSTTHPHYKIRATTIHCDMYQLVATAEKFKLAEAHMEWRAMDGAILVLDGDDIKCATQGCLRT